MKNYDDIIDLPHHVSKTHPQMSIYDRAAQFSPFAALTGYDEAVKETARRTDRKIVLSEYEEDILSERFHVLEQHLKEEPEVSVTYFVADEKKAGGSYVNFVGIVKRIDLYQRQLITMDGCAIPMDDILDISGDIFTASAQLYSE